MLVDRAGAGELVSIVLASASASFLLPVMRVVTNVERAKFDAVNCWRTVVSLAAARARMLRAVPSRSMMAAGVEITVWALPNGPPSQMLEVGTGN